MEHPVRDMVIFYKVKDLSLVYVSCVGFRVKNPVSVKAEILPVTFDNLAFLIAPYSFFAQTGVIGKALFFPARE